MAASAAPNTSCFGIIAFLHAVVMLLSPAIASLPSSNTQMLLPLNEKSIPARR